MIVAPWQGLAAAICYKSISFQICKGALLIIAQSQIHARDASFQSFIDFLTSMYIDMYSKM